MGREQSLSLNITVSGGSGTGTVTNVWETIRWLRIKPVAETDTYNLTISDGEGIIMLSRTGYTGTFSERIEMSMGIMKTIQIDSATQDGTYKARFDMH